MTRFASWTGSKLQNHVSGQVMVPMQDAYLPQRLVDKLMYMYNYIEMARVTGVPMSFLLTRGQSIKVFSQILRKARQKNLLVPFLKVCHSSSADRSVHTTSHANGIPDNSHAHAL